MGLDNTIEAIFVVGTGRSGTHFTSRVLCCHENLNDFRGGHENTFMLRRIARTAMHGDPYPALADIRNRLVSWRAAAAGKIWVDQQHPNLWHIDHLARAFPRAVFLFPDRPAVQVVASMIRHNGVSGWYKKIRSGQLPLGYPNRFFGLDSAEDLERLPLHVICARRVRAHRNEILAIQARLGNHRVRVLAYEALVHDRAAALSKVFTKDEYAAFGALSDKVMGNPASLGKYREDLSEIEIAEIEAVMAE